MQLDNPSPWVALPVTLMVPAPFSKLASTVAAAVDVQRKPALVARLALWQRRPAGVLCVELADLQLAPVAVYVEQQHALQLAEFLAGMSGSFEAAAAAPAAAGHGGGGGDGSSQAGSEASFHQAAVAAGAAAVAAPGSSSLGAVASVAARLPGLHPDLEVGARRGSTWLCRCCTPPRVPAAQRFDICHPLPPPVLPIRPQALLSGRGLLAPAEQKVYIDVLRISTLELTLSFMPAPFQPDPGACSSCQEGCSDCAVLCCAGLCQSS